MKKVILSLSIVCFTSQSFAAPNVLLISPLVKYDEQDLSFTKGYKSFSSYYLENFPTEKNVDNLLNEFESAQKYYLVKSYDLARQHYENVVAFSDVDEWREIQRKIIFLSYLRLSELNQQNESEWILQALRFSLETNPAKLDLSKETLKKISNLKKNFLNETINWQVSHFKKEFNFILINGHTVDLKKIETIKIPSGKFRITFLSDVYKPQTYQVSSQQIPLLVPTRIPFVTGNCEKPFINNEGEILIEVSAYYSKSCIKHLIGKKWIADKDGTIGNYVPINEAPNFNSTKYEKPFYKEKWFLVTLGIIGTAVAVSALSNGQKKPTHETVSGF